MSTPLNGIFNFLMKKLICKKYGNGTGNLVEVANSTFSSLALNKNSFFVNMTILTKIIDKQYYFVKFEASNDNKNFSNPIYLTAYNKKSFVCSDFICSSIVVS